MLVFVWGADKLGANSSKSHLEISGEASRRSRKTDIAVSLVEIAGRVKWFDVSKGYGFIIPDNGEPDVLLHVTVLRRDGFQSDP